MVNPSFLRVENLSKDFPSPTGKFRAVVRTLQSISLTINKGETLGLVGESGCGKSTLGRCLVRLLDPSSGRLFFQGQDITKISGKPLRDLRRKMQIIFQDPLASLNPRMTVALAIEQPLLIHRLLSSREDRRNRVQELAELVGLRIDQLDRHPHELSGGQRQRVGIARALAVEPEFIVCDEPVSALDMSIQAQVLNLLLDLQQKMGLTYLFISHDLKVVEHMADRIAVMYLGQIVETAPAQDLYRRAYHPYTKALLSAIPSFELKKNRPT